MIRTVSFEKTTYAEIPHKFEAGTPNIAGAIGLGAAIDYVQFLDLEAISAHELDLMAYGILALSSLDELRILGAAKEKAGAISFIIGDIHPNDIGTILNEDGIAIRTGHQCAQPLMDFFKIPAAARVSFGLYNTREDIDALIVSIKRVLEVFH